MKNQLLIIFECALDMEKNYKCVSLIARENRG